MKKVFAVIFSVVLLLCINFSVCASDENYEVSAEDYLPQDTIEMLEDNGIKSFDLGKLAEMDVRDALDYIIKCVKKEVSAPLTLIYVIFLVIVLTVLTSGLSGGFLNLELEKNFSIVSILCVCVSLVLPIVSCLEEARKFIENTTAFAKVFVPGLATVMLASGQGKTALGYQTTMIFAVEFVSTFLLNTVLTLLYMYLAFSIVSKVAGEYNLDMITKSIKSIVTWSLTLLMTLFVALITIKGVVGAGADSIALRTGKFFVGSFVPAVGAALSEAAATMYKSVGLIKNTTGIFGIIASVMYFVPPLIKVLVYKFTCNIASAAAELLGTDKISSLLKDVSTVLNLILSVILSYAALIILSTAVILCVGGN